MLVQNMKPKIIRFTYKAPLDFNVADTSLAVDIPIWGKDYVLGIYGRIKTAFTGVAATIKIGTILDDDCILRETNLSEVVALRSHLYGNVLPWHGNTPTFPICNYNVYPELGYNETVPKITFTSSGGNLNALTAGELEIVLFRIVVDE